MKYAIKIVATILFVATCFSASAQTMFLQRMKLANNDSVTINISEVRVMYELANGMGDLRYGYPNTVIATKSDFDDILAASCGNLIQVTALQQGVYKRMAFNPQWVYRVYRLGSQTKIQMREGNQIFDVQGSLESISALFDDCLSGSTVAIDTITISGDTICLTLNTNGIPVCFVLDTLTANNWYTSNGTTTDGLRVGNIMQSAWWRSVMDSTGFIRHQFGLIAGSRTNLNKDSAALYFSSPQSVSYFSAKRDSTTTAWYNDSMFHRMVFKKDGLFIVTDTGGLFFIRADSIVFEPMTLPVSDEGDILAVTGGDSGNRTLHRIEGAFGASVLSYAAGSAGDKWEVVAPNRTSISITDASVIVSESIQDIFIDSTGGGTVQLNFTPSMPSSLYTTWRNIHNRTSGVTTVTTNQSWQFRDATGDIGTSFSIPAEHSARLVWKYDAVAANQRFFVVLYHNGANLDRNIYDVDGTILDGRVATVAGDLDFDGSSASVGKYIQMIMGAAATGEAALLLEHGTGNGVLVTHTLTSDGLAYISLLGDLANGATLGYNIAGGGSNIVVANGDGVNVETEPADIFRVAAPIVAANDVSPAAIGASQNNYNPTSWNDVFHGRLSATTRVNITGHVSGHDGRLMMLSNNSRNPITLPNLSTSSTGGNRWSIGYNYTLDSAKATLAYYDGVIDKWKLLDPGSLYTGSGRLAGGASQHVYASYMHDTLNDFGIGYLPSFPSDSKTSFGAFGLHMDGDGGFSVAGKETYIKGSDFNLLATSYIAARESGFDLEAFDRLTIGGSQRQAVFLGTPEISRFYLSHAHDNFQTIEVGTRKKLNAVPSVRNDFAYFYHGGGEAGTDTLAMSMWFGLPNFTDTTTSAQYAVSKDRGWGIQNIFTGSGITATKGYNWIKVRGAIGIGDTTNTTVSFYNDSYYLPNTTPAASGCDTCIWITTGSGPNQTFLIDKTEFCCGAGGTENIYNTDDLLKAGGTTVGLDSGSLKLNMATNAGATKYGLEIIGSTATASNRFWSTRTESDSSRYQEFNGEFYLITTSDLQLNTSDQERHLADSVQWIEGTVQDIDSTRFILAMTPTGWMKRLDADDYPAGYVMTSNGNKWYAAAPAAGGISLGSANQIFGVNAAGTANEYKTINGTTNRITVAHAANSITLSAPQDIHTAATPTFSDLTLTDDLVVNDDISMTGGTAQSFTMSGSLSNSFQMNGDATVFIGDGTGNADLQFSGSGMDLGFVGESVSYIEQTSKSTSSATIATFPTNPIFIQQQNDGAALDNTHILGGTIWKSRGVSGALGIGAQYLARASQTWTNTARGTQLEFATVANDSTTVRNRLTILNSGQARLNAYGSGTFTGTPAFAAGWDSNGNFVEFAVPSGGTNYQTFRDDGVAATQRANANFVSNSDIAFTLTDDAGNNETEVTADIPANAVDNSEFRQSAGLSVVGRSANSTGDVADITAASDHQVLRRNGTSIAFGAVNLASTNAVTGILAGGNGGTGTSSFGAANRIPYASSATVLTNSANLTYDGSRFAAGLSSSTTAGVDLNGYTTSTLGSPVLTATFRQMRFLGTPSTATNNVNYQPLYIGATISNDGTPTGGSNQGLVVETSVSSPTRLSNYSGGVFTVSSTSSNVDVLYGLRTAITDWTTGASLDNRTAMSFDCLKRGDAVDIHTGRGVQGRVLDLSTSGRWNSGVAADFQVQQALTGRGMLASIFNSRGTGNTQYGSDISLSTSGSGVTTTNAYGHNISITTSSSGAVTNAYAIHMTSATTGITNAYFLYNTTNWRNYINGGLAIGANSTASKLFVQGAGNTSATTVATFENSSGTDALVITDDTKVVVAGTTPTTNAELTVNGDMASGSQSSITLSNQVSHAAGRFAADGDAQYMRIVMRREITGTSETDLFIDGSSARPTIASNTIWTGWINCNGVIKTVGNGSTIVAGDAFSYHEPFTIKNVGGTTTLMTPVIGIGEAWRDASMSAAAFQLSADNTNDALKITFLPPVGNAGSTTVSRAVCTVEITQTGF